MGLLRRSWGPDWEKSGGADVWCSGGGRRELRERAELSVKEASGSTVAVGSRGMISCEQWGGPVSRDSTSR